MALALAGATAVVAAELAAIALSVRLSAAAVDGVVPASTPPLPLVVVGLAAAGFAVGVRRRAADAVPLAAGGVALIVAAPFTAFGGGCGMTTGGLTVFRSGVRIGIGVDSCVAFSNGALLVVGYGLLSAGLWLAVDGLSLPSFGRWRVPRRPD